MKFTIIFLLLVISEVSTACSCGRSSVEDYAESCDSIFVARLNEAHVEDSQTPNSAIEGTFSKPSEIFKGDPNLVDGLRTSMVGTSCEQKPIVGINYLVCGQDYSKATYSHCSYTTFAEMYGTNHIIEELRKQPLNKKSKPTEKDSAASQ